MRRFVESTLPFPTATVCVSQMTTKHRSVTKAKAPATGIIGGPNKGFKTTPRAKQVSKKVRLAVQHPKLRAVKNVIDDLVGFTPFEKRIQELLRVSKEKRALKLAKKRLGNLVAAKKKRTKMEDALRNIASKKK